MKVTVNFIFTGSMVTQVFAARKFDQKVSSGNQLKVKFCRLWPRYWQLNLNLIRKVSFDLQEKSLLATPCAVVSRLDFACSGKKLKELIFGKNL